MWLRILAALALLVVAAAVVNYLRPIPPVSPIQAPEVRATDVVAGAPPALPFPSRGSAAVSVSGLGFIASSGSAPAIPAASVTKVMTALVLLEDKPMKNGETGPTITLSDADVQLYQKDVANKESTVPVESGEQITELQAVEAMLIPSANNLAETLARWDAGSIDSFVTRMNTKASALHMTHTKFTDVSGASPNSVSTASDLVALGMAAMQEQEVIAQVVAMQQAQVPVAGTVYNVNHVLGQSGIVGIKTGSGLDSGDNFLFAANVTASGHTIVVYGCVMGQPTLDIAFASAQTLVGAMASALKVQRVISRNQTLATYVTPWGPQTELVSTVDVDLVEWPGMVLRQYVTAKTIVVDHPIAASTVEGTDHLVLGDYSLDIPLATFQPLYPPGRFWRLTRVSF